MYVEEDTIYIPLSTDRVCEQEHVPDPRKEECYQSYAFAEGLHFLANEDPRPFRTFWYPDDYEGEEVTLLVTPSSFAPPSSYWDGAHHEVKEGQSTQWLLDSGTTFSHHRHR